MMPPKMVKLSYSLNDLFLKKISTYEGKAYLIPGMGV